MKRVLLYLSLVLTCQWMLAQTAGEDAIYTGLQQYVRNIADFSRKHPQEKVYLHMDNRSYYIGDTIWFKAYVMDAATLHPTQTSGVLYVELLNENGVEMEHKKMHLRHGMCHGDFILKEAYRTGYYEIRAYTRNMLNWGNVYGSNESFSLSMLSAEEREENSHLYNFQANDLIPPYNYCVFSRVFPVFMKPYKKGEFKEEMDFYPFHTSLAFPKETHYEFREQNVRLSFFPEGGSLVEGVPSIVAFEATDQWGRKIEIEGYLTQGRKNKMLEFATSGRGRGFFSLCPKKGVKYYAHLEYKGRKYQFLLPEAIPQGYVLTVHPPVGRDNAEFRVSSAQVAKPDTATLGWTLLCRGGLLAFDTLEIVSGSHVDVDIPSSRLRSGVHQLTLFNSRGEVLADRLFFVCPPREQATLGLAELPDTVAPYERIQLDFQANGPSGYFTQGCFSLAVTDDDERGGPSFDTRDIRSELLLSSDLKGFIEDVDSYFRHTTEQEMVSDIDMLMLVQGWRRYEWQAMSVSLPPRYTPEKGLLLDGYVISDIVVNKSYRNPDNYQHIPNLQMDISIISPEVSLTDTCSVDSLGRFRFEIDRYFTGEALMTLVLKERNRSAKKWFQRIIPSDLSLKFSYPVIDRVYSPLPCQYSHYEFNTPEGEYLYQIDMPLDWDVGATLDEVSVKKRFKRKSEIYYENPEMVIDYYKEWNHVIDRGCPLMNYESSFNEDNSILLNYHLGRFRLNDSSAALRMHDSLFIRYVDRYYKPYHMPDTVKVYTNLCTRNRLKVWQLDSQTDHRDLVRCVFSYFKRSESPRRAPYMPKHGTRHTYYEGYSRVREFYSPDYSEYALPDSTDYRRTLYWDPDVWTDHLGRASVTFHNNARTKRLHVRAEGFTRNGDLIVLDSERMNPDNE